MTQKITPDDLPDSELKVDVLLGTDSSGSHKQFAGKDIDVDSRNLEYGKTLQENQSVLSTLHIFQVIDLCINLFKSFPQPAFYLAKVGNTGNN